MTQDLKNNQPNDYRILKSFVSGGFAGMCAKTLVAPIERVKYIFIATNKQFSYKSYLTDLMFIVKTHGVLNLWRGNSMNIIRIFPYSAIDFAVFDYLRGKFYNRQDGKKSRFVLFLCGAAAGVCSMTATTPLEFIRLRLAMQRQNFSYGGNLNAFKKIYSKQGSLGFYKGFGASFIGVVIYHGFSFFIFTSLKQIIHHHSPSNSKKWYTDFLLGGVSALGQVIGYPLDILRKRMQGQHLLFQKKQIEKMMNYRELITSIFQNQNGFKGFYKGISLNLFKAPLASATSWMVKNHLNRKLDKQYDL